MRPLTGKLIVRMKEILKDSTQPCPLYAVDNGYVIFVSNNSILLEWPADKVEEGPAYSKLLDNRSHKLAENQVQNLAKWRDAIFKDGKFVKAEEVEPEGEDEEGSIVYSYGDYRIPYSWTNFSIAELFIDEPIYKLWLVKNPTILFVIGVYDKKQLVGAFTNERVEDASAKKDT